MQDCSNNLFIIFSGLTVIFTTLTVFLLSFKVGKIFAILDFITIICLTAYLLLSVDERQQCHDLKEQQKIDYNRQFLLNTLKSGECGNVCIKESESINSSKYKHYTACAVSIQVCKD
jgi:Ca2+/Na+ antiporter